MTDDFYRAGIAAERERMEAAGEFPPPRTAKRIVPFAPRQTTVLRRGGDHSPGQPSSPGPVTNVIPTDDWQYPRGDTSLRDARAAIQIIGNTLWPDNKSVRMRYFSLSEVLVKEIWRSTDQGFDPRQCRALHSMFTAVHQTQILGFPEPWSYDINVVNFLVECMKENLYSQHVVSAVCGMSFGKNTAAIMTPERVHRWHAWLAFFRSWIESMAVYQQAATERQQQQEQQDHRHAGMATDGQADRLEEVYR